MSLHPGLTLPDSLTSVRPHAAVITRVTLNQHGATRAVQSASPREESQHRKPPPSDHAGRRRRRYNKAVTLRTEQDCSHITRSGYYAQVVSLSYNRSV